MLLFNIFTYFNNSIIGLKSNLNLCYTKKIVVVGILDLLSIYPFKYINVQIKCIITFSGYGVLRVRVYVILNFRLGLGFD